jgi:hypothetical protein
MFFTVNTRPHVTHSTCTKAITIPKLTQLLYKRMCLQLPVALLLFFSLEFSQFSISCGVTPGQQRHTGSRRPSSIRSNLQVAPSALHFRLLFNPSLYSGISTRTNLMWRIMRRSGSRSFLLRCLLYVAFLAVTRYKLATYLVEASTSLAHPGCPSCQSPISQILDIRLSCSLAP